MPEGPEVYCCVQFLKTVFENKNKTVVSSSSFDLCSNSYCCQNEKGWTIHSHGKFIWGRTEKGGGFLCRLGLSGEFYGCGRARSSKYQHKKNNKVDPIHVDIYLSSDEENDNDNEKLVFSDISGYGMFKFMDPQSFQREWENEMEKMGPCWINELVQSKNPNKETWKARLKQKGNRARIGTVLCNQAIYAGIGNYLRSEILFCAQIHPFRKSNTLTDKEWNRLIDCAIHIIKECMEKRWSMRIYNRKLALICGDLDNWTDFHTHNQEDKVLTVQNLIMDGTRKVFICPQVQVLP